MCHSGVTIHNTFSFKNKFFFSNNAVIILNLSKNTGKNKVCVLA